MQSKSMISMNRKSTIFECYAFLNTKSSKISDFWELENALHFLKFKKKIEVS
jgi:hypothetical protein